MIVAGAPHESQRGCPLLRGQLNWHLLPSLANWFVSDALSLAIFTPAALVFWTGEVAHLLRADPPRGAGVSLATPFDTPLQTRYIWLV